MLDPAHVLTDDMLKDLERRVADQYAIAAREMQQKYEKYMEQYKAGLSAQKEQLAAGKITQQDYDNWVYRHTMMNKRWEDMKDVLARDLQHTREIALKIAGEKIPDIYALNHNYGVYEIEHGGKIDTGLTLYNHDTAEYLLGDQRQLMPGPSDRKAAEIAANKAMQWDKEKIQSCVLQGIMQGESVHEVAKRLQDVAQMEYNAAVRYARTMITSAQNAGRYEAFRRADRLGVKLTIEWNAVLDGRTRHAHRMMHGEQTKVDEPFETPDGYTIYYPADCTGTSDAPQSFIWNCFIGDTKVASDCEIVRSYKHEFKGSLIRVRTAAGVDFTCTPNHPILTPDGWIPAAFLHKGNHLLITRVGDDGSLTRNGNVYHVHSSIKALHDSLKSLGNSERISMSDFNFHGDVPTSDVEVVSKKRLLRNDGNTCGGQSSRKIRFILPNALRFCKRHFMLGFRRIDIPALRFVRRCRESLPFFGRRLGHAVIHRLGTIAGRDTGVAEYAINNLPAMTNIRSELLDGLAGNVFVDDVVSVDRNPGRLLFHVYNLQTESGYYFVGKSIPQNGEKCNGNYYAIAKNCRCTLISWVEGYEGDTVKESPGMGDMSFDEWQEAYADYERRGGGSSDSNHETDIAWGAPQTMSQDQYSKWQNEFSSDVQFTRSFQERYGMTPQEAADSFDRDPESGKWLDEIGRQALDTLESPYQRYGAGYVANADGSRAINKYLRKGEVGRLYKKDDMQSTIDAMKELISATTVPNDMVVDRWVHAGVLERMGINIGDHGDVYRIGHAFCIDGLNHEAIAKNIRENLIGSVITDNGFMSASACSELNVFQGSDIKFSIITPKGTHAFITDNTRESELVFMPGTQQKVKDVRVIEAEAFDHDHNSTRRTCIEILLEII